jgi:hypothetical protein
MAADCKKQGKNCHYTIDIQNNSDSVVIWAIQTFNGSGERTMVGDSLLPQQTAECRPYNFCIENRLADNDIIGRTIER